MFWIESLHLDLRSEFDDSRCIEVESNLQTVLVEAIQIICSNCNKSYHGGMMHPDPEISSTAGITFRWVQSFCGRYGILSSALSGELHLSPTKEEFILKVMAFHLGVMCRIFRSGDLYEDNV